MYMYSSYIWVICACGIFSKLCASFVSRLFLGDPRTFNVILCYLCQSDSRSVRLCFTMLLLKQITKISLYKILIIFTSVLKMENRYF